MPRLRRSAPGSRARLGLANVLRDLALRTESPARSTELAQAMPLYVDTLLTDPRDPSLMFEYGRALELLGQRSAALDLYKDAIAINENDARPHIALAAAYIEAEPPDVAAAKAALAQADKINPLYA